MKAKFFKTESGKLKYDITAVSIDDYSFGHLKQGLPLRVVFFTDNNDHLPWYERDCMVFEIGLNLNLDEYEQNWHERTCKDGLVDKRYLMTSIYEIRDNLLSGLTKELKIIGIDTGTTNGKKVQAIPFSKKDIEEADFCSVDESNQELKYIDKARAAKILGISQSSLISLAKKGLIPGEHEPGIDWLFVRSHIESILRQKPEFLKKIWMHSCSVTRKNPVSIKEEATVKIILSLDYASKLLSIEKHILMELAKEGEIPAEFNKDMDEWFFIKSDFEKLQIEKPALLLKIKELGLKA